MAAKQKNTHTFYHGYRDYVWCIVESDHDILHRTGSYICILPHRSKIVTDKSYHQLCLIISCAEDTDLTDSAAVALRY